MQRLAGLTLSVFVLQDVATALAVTAQQQAGIRQRCGAEWGSNYRMVAYCIDRHVEAVGALNRVPTGVPREIVDGIVGRCRDEWGDNWRMVRYCRDRQVDAWRRLQ